MSSDLDSLIGQAADLLYHSRRLVVFTGAGVSTESGIPDFRSPGGIWSKYDPEDFTINKIVSSREVRRKIWQMGDSTFKDAKPNPAHYAISELEKMGKLDCLITQNVDNLHQMAGNSSQKIYELHGNMREAVCLGCHRRFSIEEIRKRVRSGDEVPECDFCHGIIKPAGVFFGEPLPQKELQEAMEHSMRADIFMVVGSTLVVYPAALMPEYALQSGAKLIIINLSETPLDYRAALLLMGKAGEILPRIVSRMKEKLSHESREK